MIEDMEFNEDDQVYTYPCPCRREIPNLPGKLSRRWSDRQTEMAIRKNYETEKTLPVVLLAHLWFRVIYEADDFAGGDEEETSFQVDTAIAV